MCPTNAPKILMWHLEWFQKYFWIYVKKLPFLGAFGILFSCNFFSIILKTLDLQNTNFAHSCNTLQSITPPNFRLITEIIFEKSWKTPVFDQCSINFPSTVGLHLGKDTDCPPKNIHKWIKGRPEQQHNRVSIDQLCSSMRHLWATISNKISQAQSRKTLGNTRKWL